MVVLAALIVLAGRHSETGRGVLDHRDERLAGMDLQATALAGLVVISAVVVAFVVEIAKGHEGSPYSWLGALGGVSYLLALGLLRWRG